MSPREADSSPSKPRPPGARKKPAALRRAETPDRPPVTHGFYKSFDGTRMFYSIEGTGKPLVFCYGLVCSSLHWTYQIEHFARSHKAIWFDYRGHQNSDFPADLGSLTIDTIAHDIECLFDELQLKDAILLGHSMGVNAVLEFYKRCPERVAGMVLANGTPSRPLETLFNMNAFQAGFRLLKKAYDKSPSLVTKFWKLQKGNPLARMLTTLGGFNPYLTPKEDVALYVDQVAEMDPRILIHLIQNYDTFDATSWLHTVRVPTLILAGQEDKIIPLEQQELMAQLIPGAELAVIRHGSHCPQMDLPELVNHRIADFLRRIEYA